MSLFFEVNSNLCFLNLSTIFIEALTPKSDDINWSSISINEFSSSFFLPITEVNAFSTFWADFESPVLF